MSELELQKLLYLIWRLGQPITLHFVRGRYGPYDHRLDRTLADLEGHHFIGFGDHSSKVTEYAPLTLTAGALAEAQQELDSQSVARIDAALDLAQGFETPYGMELLATVDFAARGDVPTSDLNAISARVASWNIRKARLFTDAHVKVAAARLQEHGLLPA